MRREMVEILAGLEPGEAVALDPIKAGGYLKDQQPADGGEVNHERRR
jgi:hypothetical protein